ncbi:HslU--HslV peptidase proteolytic subunit [candidate division KSB1 bacterium]|nr:ATP-dependent protease subunit HslV [bacterium]OQX58948.1 MAG: HslU--HslV peptidase proteolytic subunit [candidate division KSB1 bacterium 4484_219]RKY80544.1 MAG: HslU--HslV peptidase proteolytic subunit [candidate division KSB1 bacterium]HDI52404.1 ATP-dependent protease subunit HslV [Bacteroidota bacterium]RKY88414.1 MAG: HslU--HslV peptidase proteolytic subunit [candidate division KSB1 bacterium]
MKIRSTTILGVKRDGVVAIGGDGQVSVGNTIMKANARKIRKMHNGTILAGFAGAAADAFTLFEKFESKLEHFHGNLYRSAVELAKEWRTDKFLRRLEALLAVMDREHALIISGTGEIVEPDDNVVAIGSGGPYALAAARALLKYTDLSAPEIVREALQITASICVFTNDKILIEVL